MSAFVRRIAPLAAITATACVVRDTTIPETFLEANVTALTSQQTATFAFSSNEDPIEFECALDHGPYVACTSPWTTPALADGAHVFQVVAVDPADNRDETPAEFAWEINSAIPTLLITGPNEATNQAEATFSVASNYAVATFRCRVDNEPFAPCFDATEFAAAYVYTVSTEAPHTFSVEAETSTGLVGSGSYTWTYDHTPPTIALTNPPATRNNQTSYEFLFTVDEPITGASCWLDSTMPIGSPCGGGSFGPRTLAEGSHVFKVSTTDLAGNSSAVTATWTTDLTKPLLDVSHANGKWRAKVNEISTVTATGLSATLQPEVWREWGNAPSTLGTHGITVTAKDRAGNSRTVSYEYCNDNPSGTICDD